MINHYILNEFLLFYNPLNILMVFLDQLNFIKLTPQMFYLINVQMHFIYKHYLISMFNLLNLIHLLQVINLLIKKVYLIY